MCGRRNVYFGGKMSQTRRSLRIIAGFTLVFLISGVLHMTLYASLISNLDKDAEADVTEVEPTMDTKDEANLISDNGDDNTYTETSAPIEVLDGDGTIAEKNSNPWTWVALGGLVAVVIVVGAIIVSNFKKWFVLVLFLVDVAKVGILGLMTK